MSKAILEFSNVVKRFGDTLIVDGISFTVAPGEFFTLLGPSGCGKTTTLRLLAGLETPDDGEIILEGRCLAAPQRGVMVPPDKRNVGMMFQSYAIWPHLSVFENVAFPLRVRREPKNEIKSRVAEALELVGLTGLAERGATQLSGGQQQRVALARAIVYTPSLLLLDEPLSNLDVKLREQMRTELRALQCRLNLAVVYVTHDQAEALALSDRIAVVNKGRLEQVGTPVEVYERPRTRFVGDFLGRTVMMKGTMRKDADRSWVEVQGNGRVAMQSGADGQFSDSEPVRILSRPEDIALLPMGEIGPNQVIGKIERVAYMGDHLEYIIGVGGRSLILPATKKERYPVGADVRLAFDPAYVTTLPQ
ncbi:MAG: ABC transporter ATP-binding protein [Burkholderiales bacterium]|nr:ABC transporter ATP-binding protein [Burkholderiales bacterium]